VKKISNAFVAVVATLIVATGCSSDPLKGKVVEFDKFQKEYQLQSEVVDWMDIWNCADLRIYDSILVAVEWKREKIFQVYNIHSKKLIGTFGSYGKGPGEFFNCPELNSVFFYKGKDLIIQLFNRGMLTLQNINLSKSIEECRLVEDGKYKLPFNIGSSKPFMTNDSRIYGMDRGVLQMFNPVTEEMTKFHKPIQIKQKLPSDKLEEIVRIMYIELAPDLDRIVSSFNVMKRLHVYNKKGEILCVIKEKGNQVFDTNEREFFVNNYVYFSQTFLSDEYILVLNQNRKGSINTNGELLLFNYDGKALNRYKLDCRMYCGAVDWNSKRIYTFNYEEGKMVSFPLTGIDN
jgi:hypothetical protein